MDQYEIQTFIWFIVVSARCVLQYLKNVRVDWIFFHPLCVAWKLSSLNRSILFDAFLVPSVPRGPMPLPAHNLFHFHLTTEILEQSK
jgi:hypothetical protein